MRQNGLRRLRFLHFIMGLFFIAIMFRLYQYQIIDKSKIVEESNKRIERDIKLYAKRGEIRDRNGVILAYTLVTSDLIVDRKSIKELQPLLTEILEAYPKADQTDIKARFDSSLDDKVVLIEAIPQDYVPTIRVLQRKGIEVVERNKRVYPNGSMASQTIGFVGKYGDGLEGLEYTFDKWLAGENGNIKTRTDEIGRKNAFADAEVKPAINGYTLYTTLDATIQYYSEKAIAEGLKINNAKRATAIVQDAKTGEILAIANTPSFDPNTPFEIPTEVNPAAEVNEGPTQQEQLSAIWRNPAIKDLYEPGSTFKILTGAMGLEEGVVTKDSTFYCPGKATFYKESIACWYYPKAHENETVKEGFQDSCNFVFIRILEKLETSAIYKHLRAFGMTERSGIELPSAKPLVIAEKNVRPINKVVMSFGHSISITPMHVMNILQAVSNDGQLNEPTIVGKVIDEHGKNIPVERKASRGQVLSSDVVEVLKEILESVVTDGSGANAYIPGYRIGGKTGTAVKTIAGEYSNDRVVVSSFAAVVPIDNPVFNILVIVDEPKTEIHGSKVAAPIAREIIYNTLQYLEIPSSAVTGKAVVVVPELIGLTVQMAREKAHELGLKLENMDAVTSENQTGSATDATAGNPEIAKMIITKQYPLSGALSSKENTIYISTRPVE